MQSVPITTKVASSNPSHGEANSMQHYVINFVSDCGKSRRDYVLLELYFCVIIGPNVSCINNIAVCSVDVQHSVQDRTTGEKHY
jgi:hypothetical protein